MAVCVSSSSPQPRSPEWCVAEAPPARAPRSTRVSQCIAEVEDTQEGELSHVATLLRDASLGSGLRHSDDPVVAGTFGCQDDDDLYPRLESGSARCPESARSSFGKSGIAEPLLRASTTEALASGRGEGYRTAVFSRTTLFTSGNGLLNSGRTLSAAVRGRGRVLSDRICRITGCAGRMTDTPPALV